MTTALPVAAAFHTPLVQHAFAPFAEAVRAAALRPPRIPVYGNTTAQPYPSDPAQISAQLCHHLLQPVRFQQEIEAMYAAGARIFVEFGPRSILTGLVRQILGDRPHVAIALNANRGRDSDRQLREAVIQLRVASITLGALDVWQVEPPPAQPARRGLVVALNGSNYLGERTRAAYAAALSDGFQIARPRPSEAERAEEKSEPMQHPSPSSPTPVSPAPLSHTDEPLSMVARLGSLHQHQRELLQLHQLFLANQADYMRACTQLLGEQQRLLIEHSAQVAPATLEHLGQSMGALHRHQAESLRLHEQYLAGQSEFAQRLLQVIVWWTPLSRH